MKPENKLFVWIFCALVTVLLGAAYLVRDVPQYIIFVVVAFPVLVGLLFLPLSFKEDGRRPTSVTDFGILSGLCSAFMCFWGAEGYLSQHTWDIPSAISIAGGSLVALMVITEAARETKFFYKKKHAIN